MSDLTFPGYRAYVAPLDDETLAKWLSMEKNTMRSYAVGPTLASVWSLNVTINTEIRPDARESADLSVWQTPQQTLTRGLGGCKDYAILKYSLLTHKGISAQVVLGEIRKLGNGDLDGNVHHAWCAVRIDDRWYAMDNLFNKPEPVETYINWTPKAACRDQTVMRYAPAQAFSINEVLEKQS